MRADREIDLIEDELCAVALRDFRELNSHERTS